MEKNLIKCGPGGHEVQDIETVQNTSLINPKPGQVIVAEGYENQGEHLVAIAFAGSDLATKVKRIVVDDPAYGVDHVYQDGEDLLTEIPMPGQYYNLLVESSVAVVVGDVFVPEGGYMVEFGDATVQDTMSRFAPIETSPAGSSDRLVTFRAL